ncbi:hypothetical protein A2866_04725 [Candidatus Roizmanbacteria bacterium RIFCSPHIGHO2_01_FULL_39_8]|uniref:Transcriptional repressor n=3 Tax=Candidatus Roizmaniibacteriota TaxID=1752723 RepID=A0A1F7GGU3_9BACT|nr:MAG: hypothetical protein A2866_04725 [Candidatus Roizmanbacteria bacterium RIFCSPHIGHO2_01_FULL_39_8]OGK28504.1 MAG: hypothetical protein A3C28_01905 [Candidatus Roizmanbacteria bacterium RIFCSPHIGHO2_02_FULL_39_9]OGK38178.1 MAG: hypothetical protein A3F60_03025 [Candidatus Roizmanbacteria bacterium RIFCSPHIGHO2_12_FULL_39_8]
MNSLKDLHDKGYRITLQRKNLLKQIRSNPQTAEEIFKSMEKKGQKIDLVSVYRGVQFFAKEGLIREIDFGDGKKRYELYGEESHHHHFICNNCKSIEDISSELEERLIEDFQSQSNFIIKDHSIELFGLCQKCI